MYMKTYLIMGDKSVDLEAHLSRSRTIITLGHQSDSAYNVLTIEDDDVDVFQCQFVRLSNTGSEEKVSVDSGSEQWKVQNGQWRTECPKGIRSRLQHACALCMGCCVNPRPAHPTYSWRMPNTPTLLNGQPIPLEGTPLKDGDVLLIGNTEIGIRTAI